MLAGREAALLASHVIDDPVLPINCIDQQGGLALSVTAHSTALPVGWIQSCSLAPHGNISANCVSTLACAYGAVDADSRITSCWP